MNIMFRLKNIFHRFFPIKKQPEKPGIRHVLPENETRPADLRYFKPIYLGKKSNRT